MKGVDRTSSCGKRGAGRTVVVSEVVLVTGIA
jgi:hypothetical protein